jgi:hypothetical protein
MGQLAHRDFSHPLLGNMHRVTGTSPDMRGNNDVKSISCSLQQRRFQLRVPGVFIFQDIYCNPRKEFRPKGIGGKTFIEQGSTGSVYDKSTGLEEAYFLAANQMMIFGG